MTTRLHALAAAFGVLNASVVLIDYAQGERGLFIAARALTATWLLSYAWHRDAS